MRVFYFFLAIFLILIASAKAVEYSLIATVAVKPIYNLLLDVTIISKEVLDNTSANASLKLNKTDLSEAGKGKEIEVDLTYEIIAPNKKNYSNRQRWHNKCY